VQCKGIDRNNPVFIRQFVEPGQPLNVCWILIHAMQQDHHRIVMLRIIAFRQPNQEVAVHIIDRDLFRRFLSPERLSSK